MQDRRFRSHGTMLPGRSIDTADCLIIEERRPMLALAGNVAASGRPNWQDGVVVEERTMRRAVVRKQVVVNGVRLSYREEREPSRQPVLVLIHGLGMSSEFFAELAPLLVDDFHVLALDLPGCGRSQDPWRDFGVRDLVRLIDDWMGAIGLERAHLLGHSLGGQIVVRLSARFPERVDRAVVVSCPPDPSAPRAWQKVLRLATDVWVEPPRVIRRAAVDYIRATPRMVWRTLKKLLRTGVQDAARAVPVPTLVVRGSRDSVVTEPWARELASLIPEAQLVQIEGGTHGLPLQMPRALAVVATRFLRAS